MVEGIVIGFSDMLSIAQTIGIVGTMVLTLYFSKRQLQSLSIDTQTRGLNDLGEKYAMRKRNVLDDTEWVGWSQWMRHIFRRGTIKETWKQIEPDKWFNPDFQSFINKEIVGAKLQT